MEVRIRVEYLLAAAIGGVFGLLLACVAFLTLVDGWPTALVTVPGLALCFISLVQLVEP